MSEERTLPVHLPQRKYTKTHRAAAQNSAEQTVMPGDAGHKYGVMLFVNLGSRDFPIILCVNPIHAREASERRYSKR